jgi:hypothetical protein
MRRSTYLVKTTSLQVSPSDSQTHHGPQLPTQRTTAASPPSKNLLPHIRRHPARTAPIAPPPHQYPPQHLRLHPTSNHALPTSHRAVTHLPNSAHNSHTFPALPRPLHLRNSSNSPPLRTPRHPNPHLDTTDQHRRAGGALRAHDNNSI